LLKFVLKKVIDKIKKRNVVCTHSYFQIFKRTLINVAVKIISIVIHLKFNCDF